MSVWFLLFLWLIESAGLANTEPRASCKRMRLRQRYKDRFGKEEVPRTSII